MIALTAKADLETVINKQGHNFGYRCSSEPAASGA